MSIVLPFLEEILLFCILLMMVAPYVNRGRIRLFGFIRGLRIPRRINNFRYKRGWL